MYFRRSLSLGGYLLVGVIIAAITGNLVFSSINSGGGLLKAVLAVLLWPAIVGGFICRVLGLSTGIVNL